MEFFKKATLKKQQIVKYLLNLLESSYSSLIVDIKKLEDQISFNKEQNEELLVLPIIAITQAILSSSGDTVKNKDILDKFQINQLS